MKEPFSRKNVILAIIGLSPVNTLTLGSRTPEAAARRLPHTIPCSGLGGHTISGVDEKNHRRDAITVASPDVVMGKQIPVVDTSTTEGAKPDFADTTPPTAYGEIRSAGTTLHPCHLNMANGM